MCLPETRAVLAGNFIFISYTHGQQQSSSKQRAAHVDDVRDLERTGKKKNELKNKKSPQSDGTRTTTR